MKREKIFALVKEPEKCSIRLIDKELKAFNALIEGKREIIPFPELPGVCVIFDGNGLASKKRPSCFLPQYNDLLLGTVLFLGIDLEAGFKSLTEEQADMLEEYISVNEAGGFTGDVDKRVRKEYLSNSDETAVFGFLSEVKTKYKSVKAK